MNHAEHEAGLAPTPGYRYADRVGDRLYVAGQVPLDANGLLVAPRDPGGQALACLHNLDTLLAVHGFDRADVRRLVVYVIGEQPALAAAWQTVRDHFGGCVPPATLLGVAALGHAGQLVEIDATVTRAHGG